jgi:hypothetical protein
MPMKALAKHSGIEFALLKLANATEWSYEYKMFDQVRRGQLPGSLAQADAAAEVRKIIDTDLGDQFR